MAVRNNLAVHILRPSRESNAEPVEHYDKLKAQLGPSKSAKPVPPCGLTPRWVSVGILIAPPNHYYHQNQGPLRLKAEPTALAYLSQFNCLATICLLLLWQTSPAHAFTYFSDVPGSCELIGDTDLYSVGIRLSFYFSWVSGWIIMLFSLGEELKIIRRASNAVAIAVLIDLLISTSHGSFAVLEWFIVYPLIFITFISTAPLSMKMAISDALSVGITFFILSILMLAQPALYFTLLHQGYKSGCPVYDFAFYVPIHVYNSKWVHFCQASAILSVFGGIGILLLAVPLIVVGVRATFLGDDASEQDEHGNEDHVEHVKIPRWFPLVLKLFWGLTGASIIAFVEKSIALNHIVMPDASLKSASQLIPFLIGLFNLVNSIWTAGSYVVQQSN